MEALFVPVQVLVALNLFSTPHIYEELRARESVAGDDPEQNVTEDCALWGAPCTFLQLAHFYVFGTFLFSAHISSKFNYD